MRIKVYESHVVSKPFLLLSYTRPPLLCTILSHSGIKSKSIFNQIMASQLFWFMKFEKQKDENQSVWESCCQQSPSYYLAIHAHTSTMHHFTAQWDQIEINFQSDNGISIVLIHEIWKAKRWESKCMRVMLSAKPFLLLSYMRPPLLCTILMHSEIKSKSIFNQVMVSQLFWFIKFEN